MFSDFQVSGGKQVKDSDVARQNVVEDSDVARKRRVEEVATKKEIIEIDDDSDSHNGSSVIHVSSSKKPKVYYKFGPPSSFKGVVQQPSGHWGAQIYVNHQREWLGTFLTEIEAAMAYDSAAIKVRSSVDSNRNVPFTSITIHEPRFQSQFSSQVVLDMLQEGSYQPRYFNYLKEHSLAGLKPSRSHSHNNGEGGFNFFCMKLFEKELTPSDVGSLNRFVIPKKCAVMHFHGTVHQPADSVVVCYDRLNVEWKFRFCYWNSSQSFVLTRGWNDFIKAKKLKAKDTILFFTCQCPSDKTTTTSTKFGIDVHYHNEQQNNTLEKEGGFRLFGVQINI